MDNFLRLLARLFIGGLLLFEFLNEFGILNYKLDFTWFGLAITSIVGWSIVEIASFYLKKSCGHPMSGWAMLIAAAALYMDALGDILRLYGKFSWYDQVAHLCGGGAAAGLLFNFVWSLCYCGKIKIGILGTSLICLATTSFLGTIYEIEEYLEDYFSGSHRLGDGPDTANDLLLNAIGALIIIIIVAVVIYLKIKPQSLPSFKKGRD